MKKRLTVLVVLLGLLFLSNGNQVLAQAIQPLDSKQAIFQAIWQTINDNFYDPNFTGVNWQAIKERYQLEVERVKDDKAFRVLMDKMLKELPVSHLNIITPMQQSATGVNAVARLIDGQAVIIDVPLLSNARSQGLQLGDVIQTPFNQIAGTFVKHRQLEC